MRHDSQAPPRKHEAAATERKEKELGSKNKRQGKKKKAHLAEEADSIKFTYNREHTDITSSTILRQEDKEKERQTEGTDKKDKSADNQLLMG